MSLRLKIILALTLLATLATAAIGVTSYLATSHELGQAVDRSLDQAAEQPYTLSPDEGRGGDHRPDRPRSFDLFLVQLIGADGGVVVPSTQGALPVNSADRVVAAASAPQRTRHDVEIDGEPYRMLTLSAVSHDAPQVQAVQIARSLVESRNSVDAIRRNTLWAMLIVAAVSALIGSLVGRQVTRRLKRLTTTAEVVASTGRLDVEVPTAGADETGKLGRAFSGMLGALARSRQEQHQLVQDAGHELRTPLTSLRTNVAVLRDYERLAPVARAQLIADLDSESRELTGLVNELVQLATDGRDDEPMQPVSLAAIAERAAARTRRRTGRDVLVDAAIVDSGAVEIGGEAVAISGRPAALERAVQNLVDNAAKFAPIGRVEVRVRGGEVLVRDHGAGIPVDDLPHVFDRFYRSVRSRSEPGSGLGLSIVKSVVDGHGGTVHAANADDGGAVVGFTLPVQAMDAEVEMSAVAVDTVSTSL